MSGDGNGNTGNNLQMAHYFGANYVFLKPFDRKFFLSAVKKCLKEMCAAEPRSQVRGSRLG
jgi:hypothetical protein